MGYFAVMTRSIYIPWCTQGSLGAVHVIPLELPVRLQSLFAEQDMAQPACDHMSLLMSLPHMFQVSLRRAALQRAQEFPLLVTSRALQPV